LYFNIVHNKRIMISELSTDSSQSDIVYSIIHLRPFTFSLFPNASNGILYLRQMFLYVCSVLSDICFLLTKNEFEFFEFEFWCLTPLSAIFQLYHGDQS
jgi:hypothetical protein